MGVSKNRGTPKWMVKIMENLIKMDDLGGRPTSFGNIHMLFLEFSTPRKLTWNLPGPSSLGAKWFLKGVNSPSLRV